MAALPNLDHLTYDDFRHIYEPSDDTFLLIDALEEEAAFFADQKPSICLEIGSGSGCATAVLCRTIQGVLPTHHCLYFATDINERAIHATQATGNANNVPYLECLTADLVGPLSDRLQGQVDVLVFNPPYVPTPSEEVGGSGIMAAWAGGVNGREVIDRLLVLLPGLMSKKGVIYMVTVADNKPREIMTTMREKGSFLGKVVKKRQARNEMLSILKMYRDNRDNGGGNSTPTTPEEEEKTR